jgi:hypothetical protein
MKRLGEHILLKIVSTLFFIGKCSIASVEAARQQQQAANAISIFLKIDIKRLQQSERKLAECGRFEIVDIVKSRKVCRAALKSIMVAVASLGIGTRPHRRQRTSVLRIQRI